MSDPRPNARVDQAAVMALVRQNLNHQAIAERIGISRSYVSTIARRHGHNSRAVAPQRKSQPIKAPQSEDAILAMLLTGASQGATVRALGVSKYDVEKVVAKHRANHPIFSDPNRGAKLPPPKTLPIPDWARQAGLADDYRDTARDFGEEAAARHCRALKREAATISDAARRAA